MLLNSSLEKLVSFEMEEECDEALQEEDEKELDRKAAFSFAVFLFRVHVTKFFRDIDMSGLFRQITTRHVQRFAVVFLARIVYGSYCRSVSNSCWPGLNWGPLRWLLALFLG